MREQLPQKGIAPWRGVERGRQPVQRGLARNAQGVVQEDRMRYPGSHVQDELGPVLS
jgi:hypothetical protein